MLQTCGQQQQTTIGFNELEPERKKKKKKFNKRRTNHFDAQELLGVMETGLEQFGQVVVLSGANEAGNVVARKWTRAGMEVVEQQPKGLGVKLDDGEFGLGQLGSVHFLDVGANAESWNGQTVAVASCGSCPVGGRAPLTATLSAHLG